MDKENLSKIKYVYKIYGAGNVVHCEKYPIAYINSNYIYYKVARQSTLMMLDVKLVKDCCEGVSDLNIGHYGFNPTFFFQVVDFDSDRFTKEVFRKEISDKLERARRDAEDLRIRYEKAQSILNKLEAK